MAFAFSVESAILTCLLFFMMLGVSSTINISQLKAHFIRPKGIIIGIFCQYVISPFTAWIISLLFSFKPIMTIALIITASCPGGLISNYFCYLIHADVPLSIAMTTFSSLIAFAAIPLNSLIYIELALKNVNEKILSHENVIPVQMDWFGMLISTGVMVFGLFVGLYVSHYERRRNNSAVIFIEQLYMKYNIYDEKSDEFRKRKETKSKENRDSDKLLSKQKLNNRIKCSLSQFLVWFGTFCIVSIVGYSLYINIQSNHPFYAYEAQYFIGTFLLSLIGWLLGFCISRICRMNNNSSMAVGIETSMQNISLAIAILWLTIDDKSLAEEAIGIPLIYTISMYIAVLFVMLLCTKFGFIDSPMKYQCTIDDSHTGIEAHLERSLEKSESYVHLDDEL